MSQETRERFASWAILELMGHRRLAGYVQEAELAGQGLLRIDIPCDPPATQFYGVGSVYCLTPTTEDLSRRLAATMRPAPVHRWELPPAAAPAADHSDDPSDPADLSDPSDTPPPSSPMPAITSQLRQPIFRIEYNHSDDEHAPDYMTEHVSADTPAEARAKFETSGRYHSEILSVEEVPF